MTVIAVVIPTITGREGDLRRCVRAYRKHSPACRLYIERGHPSCGEAWQHGADKAARDGFDYLHLAADDLEPHEGWLEPAIEAVDTNTIPAPLVFEPDGSLQSAGLMGWDVYAGSHSDWMAVDSTTVPFLRRDQWQKIGMVDLHYCTDLWVSHKAREYGWPTLIRSGYRFTHHNAPREDQHGRTNRDRATYLDLIA